MPPKRKRVSKRRKLPKNPKRGQIETITVNPRASKDGRGKNLGRREVTFKATGKKGFGKWKIIDNKPA